MKEHRILFIYQFLTKGGVEAVIFNRMAELSQRGIESRAIFFQDYGGGADEFRDKILISKDQEKIKQYVQSFQPDWVLHFDTPDLVSIIPGWTPGVKQAYEVHTTYPKNYHSVQSKALLKNIRGVIVPSEFQAREVRQLLRGVVIPITVVPNGLNANFFVSQAPRISATNPVVAWVGRLEAHKNWFMYLRIVEQISTSHPESCFWMVGGSHATEQQQHILWYKIVSMGLVKRFRWFPEVPASEIPSLLQEVSRSGGCLVSTSKGESFGLAVLEAMASGCPVVVPEVGGMSELVQQGVNGYLYSPGKIKDACLAVLRIINDQAIHDAMRQKSKEQAIKYTNQAVVDRLLETLRDWDR